MNQPQLGRKIAELRKAKGYTQEELVEQCNLSVRTLQRIESGEVSPRSYTQRIIFIALEYDIHASNESVSMKIDKAVSVSGKWLAHLFRGVMDLFNLKTDTMKKLSILTLSFILIGLGINSSFSKSNAQSLDDVKQIIEENNANYIRWFNKGDIDSLLSLYRADACILPWASGEESVRAFFQADVNKGYVFKELRIESLSVCDTIAVEKCHFIIHHKEAGELRGMLMSEWRYSDKKWLIVNDIARME